MGSLSGLPFFFELMLFAWRSRPSGWPFVRSVILSEVEAFSGRPSPMPKS
jgi:hypothetical protein